MELTSREPARRSFKLGVGLTNACNLGCAHCYRAVGEDALPIAEVLRAVEALPTGAVNFGTGESALHPGFPALVRELSARGIAVTMTTNGYSSRALADDVLVLLRDVEFSIDHPDRENHDRARGAGNWDLIAEQMARCSGLGVSTTVIAVMMRTNYLELGAIARLAGARGAALRVNVYQAVRGEGLSLDYDQFWEAWRLLLESAELVTCGEPIVRAVLGLPDAHGAGCGTETVRVTPRGTVVPCVYTSDGKVSIADLAALGPAIFDEPAFAGLRTVPVSCRSCPHVATCRGGCASRRLLRGGLADPDEYCPFVRGEQITLPSSCATAGLSRAMPKASSACTTILRAITRPSG